MNKNNIICLILILVNYPAFTFAQYKFFNPKEGFAIEISLPNTDLKRLPIYRNSISSLIVIDDYIIGGTSANEGLSPFIFVASINERELISFKDVGEVVKGQQQIRSGYCRGKNNVLFAGTIANKNSGNSEVDGHLIQVNVSPQGTIHIEDLGVPVPGEGIFSLLCNFEGTLLYGITFPSGKFFKFDINTRQSKIYNDIAPTEKEFQTLNQYAIGPEKYLSKAIIQDDKGLIYGSMPVNKLFCFNPHDESFVVLEDHLPEVWGRKALGQVESWAKSDDGILYGGNAGDGQLFKLNPSTGKVVNLGKPIMMNRLRGLSFGKDGKLYGVAGALPGYTHLFVYDPESGGFLDLGNPEFKMVAPGIEQGILWRGFQIGTLTSSEDGKYIVMGEDESLSQLLIFAVGDYKLERQGY